MNLSELPSENKCSQETKITTPEEIMEGLRAISNLSEFQNNSELFQNFQNYLAAQEKRVMDKEISGLDLNIHVARMYKEAGFYSKPDLREFVLDAYDKAIEQAYFEGNSKTCDILEKELIELNK